MALLFTGIPKDATHAIISGAVRRRFRAGETLLAEGDAPAGIFVIVEGRPRWCSLTPQAWSAS